MRAMLEMGVNYDSRPLLLKDLARAQGISLKYLDHIFSVLKAKKLIKSSQRGKGYTLARPPEEISLYEIVYTFEPENLIECIGKDGLCMRDSLCGARVLWSKVNTAIKRQFLEVTLADVIREQKKLSKGHKMYYI